MCTDLRGVESNVAISKIVRLMMEDPFLSALRSCNSVFFLVIKGFWRTCKFDCCLWWFVGGWKVLVLSFLVCAVGYVGVGGACSGNIPQR